MVLAGVPNFEGVLKVAEPRCWPAVEIREISIWKGMA